MEEEVFLTPTDISLLDKKQKDKLERLEKQLRELIREYDLEILRIKKRNLKK